MDWRTHFREHWRALRKGRPGRRFQDRYEQTRRAGETGVGVRILMFFVALGCLAVAAVLAVFPGPAIPFFVLAGGLLASESRAVARFMDWAEVRARRLGDRGRRRWRRLARPAQVALLIVAVAGSAAVSFTAYRWVRG